MPRATWEAWGGSSKSPVADQMAETGLMTPGNFSHEILGQLQVALRTDQANVAKVCGEKWQLCAKIGVLFAPQQKAKDSHRMPQVVEANVPVASRALNAGGFQCMVERIAQGVNRIPSPAWAGKERLVGSAAGEVLGRQCPP